MPNKDDTKSHDKPCTICGTPRQVLVRCQIDETGKWNFVCPGKCWKDVSGGVEDAKGFEAQYPFYRYGGMWKNKHADGPISAKKPRKVKERQKTEASDRALERQTDSMPSGDEMDKEPDMRAAPAPQEGTSSHDQVHEATT